MKKNFKNFSKKRTKIIEKYLNAKELVISKGFAAEIDWQDGVRLSDISESYFLREAAWVVLSSGMREAVIRKKFHSIAGAFYFWHSAKQITENSEECKINALTVFGHEKKIKAIIYIAEQINLLGFESFRTRIQREGVDFIRKLPFMGPATSYHLAKNIGLDVVKPDRHLVRISAIAGYRNPRSLCDDISKAVGDRISVIDLVIWRFATLNPNYSEYFAW